METNRDERLERAIASIDQLIVQVGEAGLRHSGLFLEMAKLQLQLDLHGITDHEFNAFCDALESHQFASAGRERAASHARPRRNGDLRLMRRAWRRPKDSLAQRGGARAGR